MFPDLDYIDDGSGDGGVPWVGDVADETFGDYGNHPDAIISNYDGRSDDLYDSNEFDY